MIRAAMVTEDAERLAHIYNHEILTNTATFEVDTVTSEAMADRVAAVQAAGLPFIVATDVLGIIGYAYAAPFHDRAAYAHTLTASVYVDRGEQGRGVGKLLYEALLRRIAALEIPPHGPVHSVVALIALPNDASVALHESVGFKHAGTIAQVGWKFERWIDVGYWQLSMRDD
jgi:phosphinothricin acetyltransferase